MLAGKPSYLWACQSLLRAVKRFPKEALRLLNKLWIFPLGALQEIGQAE
jgi:hypothetical protein